MELHELREHWEKDLGIAETFLPNEPMAALSATRAVAAEIEEYVQAHPEARSALTLLLEQARASFVRSHEASERWLAACAERGRRYREHERRWAELPMQKLRNPWRARVSA